MVPAQEKKSREVGQGLTVKRAFATKRTATQRNAISRTTMLVEGMLACFVPVAKRTKKQVLI